MRIRGLANCYIKAFLFLTLFAGCHDAGNAQEPAASWPDRTVRMIVPFAPGGAADTLGRILANYLSQSLNQQFIVENRPGAGGMIGAQAVAQAPPDGYTFVISGIASHVIAPFVNEKPLFDSIKDFTHVAYVGGPPIILIVNPSSSMATFDDFVNQARAGADPLPYASPGTGTHMHLFAELVALKRAIRLSNIPFRGTAPSLSAVIAGHVPVGWTWNATNIQAGQVRALAVSTASRLTDLPDVPTFKELGYPDLVATTWFAISGPAGLPSAIVKKLNAEINRIIQMPEVKDRLTQEAILVSTMSPAETTAFIESEIARWQPIAKIVMKQNQ